MRIEKTLSDADILIELGKRIKTGRIRLSLTQAEFATLAGVSKGTIANVENGESIQTLNLLKILRELDSLNALELLLPSSESSPMELIRDKGEQRRQRVRKKQIRKNDSTVWKWGDDR